MGGFGGGDGRRRGRGDRTYDTVKNHAKMFMNTSKTKISLEAKMHPKDV